MATWHPSNSRAPAIISAASALSSTSNTFRPAVVGRGRGGGGGASWTPSSTGRRYLTVHGKERADQTTYSLEELILEFHILQEVVLDAMEPDHLLDTRDRGVIIQYVNEMVRVAAGEFVRVQQTLQAYADRLTQTDRSKDEFLAMLGHELRNPLGAISTALFLLQEGPADPATQKGALEVATRQARHMKQMLDDLLDLARINEGKITLQRRRVDLGAEVQQALEVASNRKGTWPQDSQTSGESLRVS